MTVTVRLFLTWFSYMHRNNLPLKRICRYTRYMYLGDVCTSVLESGSRARNMLQFSYVSKNGNHQSLEFCMNQCIQESRGEEDVVLFTSRANTSVSAMDQSCLHFWEDWTKMSGVDERKKKVPFFQTVFICLFVNRGLELLSASGSFF